MISFQQIIHDQFYFNAVIKVSASQGNRLVVAYALTTQKSSKLQTPIIKKLQNNGL